MVRLFGFRKAAVVAAQPATPDLRNELKVPVSSVVSMSVAADRHTQ